MLYFTPDGERKWHMMLKAGEERRWKQHRSLVWPDGAKGLSHHKLVGEFLDNVRSIALVERQQLSQFFLFFDPSVEKSVSTGSPHWEATIETRGFPQILVSPRDRSDTASIFWRLGSLHPKHPLIEEGYEESNTMRWVLANIRTDLKYLLMGQKLG